MTCVKTGSADLLFQNFVGCMLLLLKVRSKLNTSDNIDDGVEVTLMYILDKNSLEREHGFTSCLKITSSMVQQADASAATLVYNAMISS